MKKYLGVFLAAFVLVAAGCDKKAKEVAEIEEMAVAVDSIIKINPVLNVGQKVEAEKLINEYLEFANN